MRSLLGTPEDLDLSRAELTVRRSDDSAGRRPCLRDDVHGWPTSVELPKLPGGGEYTVTLVEWLDAAGT